MSRKVLYVFIILIGFAKIIGHFTEAEALKGLSTAYCSSPLPIVFTQKQGVENFAATFEIRSDNKTVEITPEIYSQLKGPYNRRNVYGAAIAFAPFLPDSLRNQIFHYALCDPGTLRDELGLSPSDKFEITLTSLTRNDGRKWSISTPCQ